jgi:translation initiation factor 1
VRVGRETKGRKGKGVTVVTGLPLAGAALDELATRLKKRCGSGGTVRGAVIEIQGDHRDVLVAELAKLGYQAKRSGG